MNAQNRAKEYNKQREMFERRAKAQQTVIAQLESALNEATDKNESMQIQLTQAKVLLKKAYASQQAHDGEKEEEKRNLHVALKHAKANAVDLSKANSMLASEVDRLKKDELDLRLKLEAAEKRVEIAEIQAEQDNSEAAENVKRIVLSMHDQYAEKQAAQVENQSPASVVLMQGTENKDPDPLETTSSKQSSSSIVMMKETKVNEKSESTLNDIREKVHFFRHS